MKVKKFPSLLHGFIWFILSAFFRSDLQILDNITIDTEDT